MEKLDKYKRYRNVLHQMIEKAKRNYYNNLVLNNKNNSNKLWKIIHSLSGQRQRFFFIRNDVHRVLGT